MRAQSISPTLPPPRNPTENPAPTAAPAANGWDPLLMPYPVQPVFDDLTPAQVAAIKADVIALVPFDLRTSCSQSSLACTDVLGGLVQLAFHDAGTFDKATGTGGPDGCIDLTLPENRGLRWITGVIAPVFRKYASVISFADFVVLAANTGVYVASGNNLTLPFNWGRTNGNDCLNVDRNMLPQGSKSISHIQDVFVTRMGLSLQDITALMGAHTIGRAEDSNTGYSGAWDSTSAVWDNQYYVEMVNRPWNREVRLVNNVQEFGWREPKINTLMLNTDMALAFDIGDRDVNTGTNTCNMGGESQAYGGTGGCAAQPVGSRALIGGYIASQAAWFADFAVAWQKMTELKWAGKLALPGQARPTRPVQNG